MTKTTMITMVCAALICGACNTQREVPPVTDGTPVHVISTDMKVTQQTGDNTKYIPKAVVYKTNGDYDNNVSVAMNPDRTEIMSYPDPVDVSAKSVPLHLVDGWLLDRRGGIGLNTAFLKYTYAEYAALPSVPDTGRLIASIIPGARVTEVKTLPVTLQAALADTAKINRMLRQ